MPPTWVFSWGAYLEGEHKPPWFDSSGAYVPYALRLATPLYSIGVSMTFIISAGYSLQFTFE